MRTYSDSDHRGIATRLALAPEALIGETPLTHLRGSRGSELTMTTFDRLDEFPKALLSSVLELLAERKINHPGAALTLSPDDLVSSWDLVAEAAALPDPPGHPDAGEEVASTYWYEKALGDLLGEGFLLELEDNTFRVLDLETLLPFRDSS